jgi:teichuronic acid biosynthesis glycosyltransferase TuaC
VKLLSVSNLYPRPDQPQLGMFNAQLFSAFAETDSVDNLCLVPEWRLWRWARIRGWHCPAKGGPSTRYVPVFYLPVVGRGVSHRTYASSLRRAGLAALSADADVVYASWMYPDGAALGMALPVAKPLWLMVLGSDTLHLEHAPRRRAILAAANRARGIVCVCRALAERMIDMGVANEKVHVVPNGVDTTMFRPVPRPEAFERLRSSGAPAMDRIDAASPLILFIGNLVPVKGPDVMLRAWAEFMKSTASGMPDSGTPRLLFIGDGPMRAALQRSAHELGVADSVCFAGARSHGELPLWLNAASGLCLTSRNEGMPNVVLEALAVGLPVVATDVGACREMLEGRRTAWLAPTEDTGALASALDDVLRIAPDTGRNSGPGRSWHDQAREILGMIRGRG